MKKKKAKSLRSVRELTALDDFLKVEGKLEAATSGAVELPLQRATLMPSAGITSSVNLHIHAPRAPTLGGCT